MNELEQYCLCVTKHVPLPRTYYSVITNGGIVFVCPTTYANFQDLIEQYKKYQGRPPGKVRKHYSDYVQRLVLDLVPSG